MKTKRLDPLWGYRTHWSAWQSVRTLIPRRINGHWVWWHRHYRRYGAWALMHPMLGPLVERTLIPPTSVGNVVPFRRAHN